MNKRILDKDTLEKYLQAGKTSREMAFLFNTSRTTIKREMEKYGLTKPEKENVWCK